MEQRIVVPKKLLENQAIKHTQGATYRADIDGLRAVAVLSVVGFHAFHTAMPGGFVGVDIFFVISGYLISGIIFKGLDAGRFSLSDFYIRRVCRIFPALSIVLAFCLLAGSYVLFPGPFAQLGLHVAAGAAFVSNILLWTESGYFDSDAATKPLLHLWSLGVEEQYYLFWPIILMLLGKRRTWRLAVLAAMFSASFATNLLLVRTQPVSDFYLPFTRFWELLMGAALTYATFYGPSWTSGVLGQQRVKLIRNILAWSGLVEIAVSLATFRSDQAFPGWIALLPVVGAVSLIGAGADAWFNRRVLAARVPVFFGLISYPLYLWHWPIMVFQNLSSSDFPTRTARIAAVLASICLAWLTYKFVELPIRAGRRPAFATQGLVTAVALMGIAGLALYWDHGLPSRYPEALRATALADQQFDYSAYRERVCFLQADQGSQDFAPSCVEASRGGQKPLILLWGDSHAASLYPGIRRILDEEHTGFRLGQFTASACPPIAGFVVTNRPFCNSINDFVMHYVKINKPDTVIMLASWSFYDGGGFDRLNLDEIDVTARTLKEYGVRRVIVIGPLPRWMEHQPNVVLREWNRFHQISDRSRMNFDNRTLDFDRRIRAIVNRSVAIYFSPIEALCNAQGCKVLVTKNGGVFPTAWDDAHLTSEGSEELAADLMQIVNHPD